MAVCWSYFVCFSNLHNYGFTLCLEQLYFKVKGKLLTLQYGLCTSQVLTCGILF